MTELIGSLAAVLTTASFIPQAVRVIQTRDTRSLSLPMYLMFLIGVILWVVYGCLLVQWPVIIANTITAALASVILWAKIRNG